VRTVVYRYDDLQQLADALDRAKGQGLALPGGVAVKDGEWVLAMFELGGTRRATAAAGRGALLDDGGPALLFERRDWERLRQFATASTAKTDSETRMSAAAAISNDKSAELPIDADTARSGVHAVEMGEPPMPAEPPPTGPRAPLAASALRSTMSWESNPPTTGSGEVVAVEVEAPPPPPLPAPVPTETTEAKARSSGTGSSVLIVDDDEDLRDVVIAMLETVGLYVHAVGSAEEALETLRATQIDLVLLDWSLPGMSGLEMCRLVRKDAVLSSLAIMFLTAHSGTQEMVEAFAAGADDYVVKPFRAAELGARIFGLLRRARATAPSRDAH
jgi:two-component system phosphate regulon response regulator PhoB